jgi:TonB family protein
MTDLALPLGNAQSHELVKNYQKYLIRGLIVSATIHVTLIGGYQASKYLHKEAPPVRVVRIMKYSELGPPPSIAGAEAVAPAVSVAGPVSRPSVGIPVPVPDAEVNPDQVFASQQQMSAQAAPLSTGAQTGTGADAVIEQDIQIEDDTPPPNFVPFEQEPKVISKIEPEYPNMARLANMEGKVIAYLWIDKKGKVRDVKIMKSDSEIFNQAVIDAAKQWVFAPAMMNNGPVAVWLSVPFVFNLRTAQQR